MTLSSVESNGHHVERELFLLVNNLLLPNIKAFGKIRKRARKRTRKLIRKIKRLRKSNFCKMISFFTKIALVKH